MSQVNADAGAMVQRDHYRVDDRLDPASWPRLDFASAAAV
ncbi:hypothetical protein I545_6378 [Mycobacterium kansasii 662]|uniref:Uncharacterized protein n=1 Tax=Mycobacterium kansasii 662 TaxID=1299326 RepID=X7YN69_MYCKA|nr:hypothetical protein I545_6378 [Mycobacterium kansasii 662]